MRIELLAAAVMAAAIGVTAAPAAKAAEGRRQAIDLIADAQALEAQGDNAGAIKIYLQSVQTAPSPAGYYQLGSAYARQGDKENARRYLTQALELNPNYELAKVELMNLDKGRPTRDVRKTDVIMPAAMGMEAADTAEAVNVDTLQRENLTLRSLQRPSTLAVSADPSYEPGPKTPSKFFGFVPAAPQIPRAGATPAVPRAFAQATPPGTARRALEPALPTMIENESDIKMISPQEGAPGEDNSEREVVRAAVTPGPRDLVDQGQEIGEVESSDPSLHDSDIQQDTGLENEVSAMPSAQAINNAAFGAAAQEQQSSVGYGQTRKVALGTYAFHKEKGDSYRTAERYEDAANEYKIALKLAPNDTEVRGLLAEVLAQSGDTATAERHFAKAEATDPDDPKVHYRQGNMYRDQQKPDLAIGSYRRSIGLDPSNKFAHNNLGVVYMEQGQYKQAVASFKKVLELDPNYDKAILNLGIIYDDNLDDDAQALKYYDKYLQLGGDRASEVQRWADAIRRAQGTEATE